MKLRGKLESDFKEWLCEKEYTVTVSTNEVGSDFVEPLYKVLDQLPLSMQFALLCDFLEEKSIYIDIEYEVIKGHCYWIVDIMGTTYRRRKTKEEAIEKAVDKLNEIWE